MCLPSARLTGFLTSGSPAGPCRGWLERGTCTRSQPGVPSRSLTDDEGGTDDGNHRDRPSQGDPHGRGHRLDEAASWRRSRSGPPASRRRGCWPGRSRSVSGPGPSSRLEGSATCCPSSWSEPASGSSMCRQRWPRGCGCSAPGGRTRTIRTMRCSVAIAALRSPGLRSVEPADHREVLRLLAKRNHEHREAPQHRGVPAPRRAGQPVTRRNLQGTQRF